MALALHTLTNDYRRRSAPIPTKVAYQAPVTGSLRAPADHDAFADPAEIAAELASDLTSAREQIESYLATLLVRAGNAHRDVSDEVGRISDALGDIMGELQRGAL